jgi:hypothetical protein
LLNGDFADGDVIVLSVEEDVIAIHKGAVPASRTTKEAAERKDVQ